MTVNINRTVIDMSTSGARGQPSPPSAYVVVEQTDGNANYLYTRPTTPLPNNTGEGLTFRLRPPNKGDGPVTLVVEGINVGDPWYLLGPGGDPETDQLGDEPWITPDEIEFERKPAASLWTVKRILNPTLVRLTAAANEGSDPFAQWAGAGAAALNFAGSF